MTARSLAVLRGTAQARPVPALLQLLRGTVSRLDSETGAPMVTVPDYDDAEFGPCLAAEVPSPWAAGDVAMVALLPGGSVVLLARIPPPE